MPAPYWLKRVIIESVKQASANISASRTSSGSGLYQTLIVFSAPGLSEISSMRECRTTFVLVPLVGAFSGEEESGSSGSLPVNGRSNSRPGVNRRNGRSTRTSRQGETEQWTGSEGASTVRVGSVGFGVRTRVGIRVVGLVRGRALALVLLLVVFGDEIERDLVRSVAVEEHLHSVFGDVFHREYLVHGNAGVAIAKVELGHAQHDRFLI